MPEHTIPAQLVEDIRNRRVALVIGAGIGVPSWKQLLESINEELRSRGGDGDAAFAKDVDRLLHKGNLVRAASFLARTMGEDACDRHMRELWASCGETLDVARAIAQLPIRQIWTTFPGDSLERAMETESPEHWPSPRVFTYAEAGGIDRRRRTLLKVLGDFDSFAVTSKSVRIALAGADDLRDYVREDYASGSLILVGFRFGNPDLAALLDRLLGSYEPPETNHYMVASGVGPVTVDELASDHHIEVINLPGKGADDKATTSLLAFLEALRVECDKLGLTLAQQEPDAEDLEGWLGVLSSGLEAGDDADVATATEAMRAIEAAARENGDTDHLVEVLMARVEYEPDASARAGLLRQVAEVFETQVGDVPGAFTALTAALREDPADMASVDAAERLADAADGWTELVGDVSEVAREIDDRSVAAIYWARLGRWYLYKLNHLDYAAAAFREALKLGASETEVYAGLAETLRKQQSWGELVDVLRAQVEVEVDGNTLVDLHLALGDLYENQLASTAKAMDAYQNAADLDDTCEDALVALERLYRRDERWGKLASVLERRAELFEQAGESSRASVARRELAALRTEKLGDLEGAIVRYEAAVAANAHDIDALRALEDLYQKVGRTKDYLRTLEQLVDEVPAVEKAALLRRLAAECEEREDGVELAIDCYLRLVELEPAAEDAYRALERNLRNQKRWAELVDIFERHIEIVTAPSPRVDLYTAMADLYESELKEPERAIECHLSALGAIDGHEDSLVALVHLYSDTDNWSQAVDVLSQLARKGDAKAADYCAQAGTITADELGDLDVAKTKFEHALEFDAEHYPALAGLAHLHKQAKNWASAVDRFLEAERACTNRLERIKLLLDAASIYADELDRPGDAIVTWQRALELDPDNETAASLLAEALEAAERFDDMLPVVQALARNAPEPAERALRELRVARVCERLGHFQKATKHYQLGVEADRNNMDCALGLASTLFSSAQSANRGANDWSAVEARYRDLVVRHKAHLDSAQLAETWHRIGLSMMARGEHVKAHDALTRALTEQPDNSHVLASMVDVATEREDWPSVVATKRKQLEGLALDAENERCELLEEIGDLLVEKLGRSESALEVYTRAIEIRPDDHKLLHKALEIHSESKNWRKAIEILDAIAGTAKSKQRRAKYFYAAAVIARDEVSELGLATDYFQKSLEENPENPKAVSALEELMLRQNDWNGLARSYRKTLKALGEDTPAAVLVDLWGRLGDVCSEHLGDTESAITAYEVAVSLDPDNMQRHEELANLYLESGDGHRKDAIEELQVLIAHDPERVELYRALSQLYIAAKEHDKAYCLAQALVFLKAATQVEADLYRTHRPERFVPARHKLTEELWQNAILHQSEDRHLNAIFSSVVDSVAATTAQAPSAFNIPNRDDSDQDTRPVSKVFKYASSVLGIELEPRLCVQPESDGVRVANTAEKGKLKPTIVIGGQDADRDNERELAFEVGKRLAYLRPDRYVHYALQTLPKLESAYYGALAASGADNAPEAEGEVGKFASHIKQTVPSAVLEQVGALANRMNVPAGNGVVAGWRSATDLTANRVGLILCDDLETAARAVATEPSSASTQSAKDRLRDLLAYSVSEEYFSVRRHLGLAIQE